VFVIYEPKKRIIKSLEFKHKVVQFALCNVLEPIFEKSFIYHSYACRKNKGTHKCVENIFSLISKQNNNSKYCLKCDVKKYFQSVNQNILKKILFKKIKDSKIQNILNIIINSDNSDFGIHKGIPIGNLTSQLFANIYLNELDQYIKHIL
jgi:retron-type reverse transcriptase